MKKLKLEDYSKIKPYLDMANYEGYNSNFITMMMWNHEYHIQYEIHNHFLIMLHNYKGIYFWAMPFTTPKYYKEAINYMIDYSQKHDFEFMIDCATEEFVNILKTIDDGKLLYQRTPYNDDYIYDRQMQETLSGKKMQKRRNHYNSFQKNYPHYIYRDLDEVKDFDIILECLTRWEKDKEELSETMTSEIYGILYLLSTRHLLKFEVGGIFIDGVMEAFIIASQLNHQTIQIHVEKANKNIRGLYPAILKELLEHHYKDDLYINREEDMGLDNLKKSKLALHPVKMIKKYKITLKNLHIIQANDNDFNDIVQLWKNNFTDENEKSTQFYFDNIYNKKNTYLLKNKNDLISVCQIIPYEMSIHGQSQVYYFIAGVCTQKEYEGQGCMKYLLNHILHMKQYNNQLIYLQAYIPDIYRSLGFSISHFHQKIEIEKEYYNDIGHIYVKKNFSVNELLELYNKFITKFDEYRMRDIDYYQNYFLPRTKIFEQQIILFAHDNQNIGYVIYENNDEYIYIYEIIYLSHLNNILSYFNQFNKKVIVECDLKTKINGTISLRQCMMSRQINKDRCLNKYYINEVY